jgi:hypothetical protein
MSGENYCLLRMGKYSHNNPVVARYPGVGADRIRESRLRSAPTHAVLWGKVPGMLHARAQIYGVHRIDFSTLTVLPADVLSFP